ncbi:MAG: hypothetical protein P4L36_14280 [Holophaga sp.]|nr:hypothetical protein [Holophaga sp.]
MVLFPKRLGVVLAVPALLVLAAGLGAYLKVARDVRGALAQPARNRADLRLVPLPEQARIERWGGGEVEAVAGAGDDLTTAGGFGVRDSAGDLSWGLPTLGAAALTLWRGRPALGLAAGGLYLRRDGRWEELLSGFGTLHVRTLCESSGGQLWIGAREGLFRAAWGAPVLERLDPAPVRSIALGEGGLLVAGGEEGLRRVSPGRVTPLAAPDPWIDWVGLCGGDLWVVSAAGLARGPVDGALAPVAGGEDVASAAVVGSRVYAAGGGRLLRYEGSGNGAEEFLPARPRKLLAASGQVFADTEAGLYRQAGSGWVLARPRSMALPPGSAHVSALGLLGSRLVLGAFDGGLALGQPAGQDWAWSRMPGAPAWAVNAILTSGDGLYVASLRGAARFDGRRWTAMPGGAEGPAFALAATRDGIAVGYGQGLLLPGSRFLSAFHGLPGNQTLALAGGDPLFVGTPSGLGAVSGSKVAWRVTAGEGRLPHPWVTALALRADALYIGTYGGGVARRTAGGPPQGRFQPFPETDGFKVNPGCLVEAGGRLFLGTDGQGLFRLSQDGSRFEPLRLALPSPRITAILPGADALYVGTDEGLARLRLPLADGGA